MAARQPSAPERWLERACAAAAPLALGVTVLLFAQWPLRDGVGAGSTQANDAAQVLFALHVAVALTHARRRSAHLQPRTLRSPPRWHAIVGALLVLPWATYLAFSAWPATAQAFALAERFPDTLNPGYFLIRGALLLMALLVVAQSLAELRRSLGRG